MCVQRSVQALCLVTWPDTSQLWLEADQPSIESATGCRGTQGTQDKADSYPVSSNSAPGAAVCTPLHTDICASWSVTLSELHSPKSHSLNPHFFPSSNTFLASTNDKGLTAGHNSICNHYYLSMTPCKRQISWKNGISLYMISTFTLPPSFYNINYRSTPKHSKTTFDSS